MTRAIANLHREEIGLCARLDPTRNLIPEAILRDLMAPPFRHHIFGCTNRKATTSMIATDKSSGAS